jgi:hypothetical protein
MSDEHYWCVVQINAISTQRDEARAEIERLRGILEYQAAKVERLRGAVQAVRDLHVDANDAGWCDECDLRLPCPTLLALDAALDDETA